MASYARTSLLVACWFLICTAGTVPTSTEEPGVAGNPTSSDSGQTTSLPPYSTAPSGTSDSLSSASSVSRDIDMSTMEPSNRPLTSTTVTGSRTPGTTEGLSVTTEALNVTTDMVNVTTDALNVTTEEAANVTAEPLNVTTEPLNATADTVNVTTEGVDVTPDSLNVTTVAVDFTDDFGNITTTNETVSSTTEMTSSTTELSTTTTETPTTTPRLPSFLSAAPLFGPIAGGTVVIVKGTNLDMVNATKVKLGPRTVDIESQTSEIIRFLTPEMEVYTAYAILLEGPVLIPTGFQFTFKRNPTVSKIFPTSILMSGGIKLFAEGTHLDSTAKPVLLMYVRFTSGDKVAEEDFSQVCTPLNSTLLECITPNITLVEGLIDTRGRRSLPDTEIRSRHKREFVLQKKVAISIQLGLEFDGFRQYENVSRALPEYGQLTVVPNPTIHTFNGIRTHASADVYLNLTGENMDEGCTIHDYNVSVADQECVMVSLGPSWLLCTPPDLESVLNNITGVARGDVIVNIGQFISQEVGTLRYLLPPADPVVDSGKDGIDFALLFGVLSACVAITVIIIVIGILKFKPCDKSPTKASGYTRQPAHQPQFTDASRYHTNQDTQGSQQLKGARGRIPVFNIFRQSGDYLENMGRPPDVDSMKSVADDNNITATRSMTTGRYMVHSESLTEGGFPVY